MDRSPQLSRRASEITLVGAALISLALAALRWVNPATWNFVDLQVFVDGARSVLAGKDLYATAPGAFPFTYPPFAGVAFVPLGLTSLTTTRWVWTALSIAALAVMVWTSVRVSAPTMPRSRRLVWVLVLLATCAGLEPVQRTLIFGQVNLVLGALVLLDVLVVPPRWRGLLIGLAAGIKLTPAYFALYFVLRRDWTSLARSAVAFVGSALVAWLVFPGASRQYWGGGIVNLDKFGAYAVLPSNQSLRAALVRMAGPGPEVALLLVPLIAGVVVLSLIAARRLIRREEHLAALTCLGTAALLVSPISWTHHWVWVVPVLVVLAHRRWYAGLVVTVAVMFLPPMWASDATNGLPVVHEVCANAFVVLALVYLAVSAFAPPRGPRRPTTSRWVILKAP
jgi:alpha-1,2-mannosyltransferase